MSAVSGQSNQHRTGVKHRMAEYSSWQHATVAGAHATGAGSVRPGSWSSLGSNELPCPDAVGLHDADALGADDAAESDSAGQLGQDVSSDSGDVSRARGLEAGGGQPSRRSPGRRPIPPKLYRIGELVDFSGMSRQTIHNYTTMGLLRESRWTDGGHRLYDESAFRRLNMIAEFKSQDRSLEYIRQYFARLDGEAGDGGPAPQDAGQNGQT